MTPEEEFETYRRLLASAEDEEVYWWYIGTTLVVLDNGMSVPISHPETVMIYSVHTLSGDAFEIHWREVGYFRDPVTGDIASSWLNPFTGETVQCPSSFKEGPATYTIRRSANGLQVSLTQNHAVVRGIDVKMEQADGCVIITQTEHKVRSFPDKDGIIRDLADGGGAEAQTILMFSANADEVHEKENGWVNASGTYEFRLQTIPDWMGFSPDAGNTVVHGVIVKGRPSEKLNPLAWERLDDLYPGFFSE